MRLLKQVRGAIPAKYKPLNYLQRLAEKKTNSRVRGGPFKGQIIGYYGTQHSAYIPKVLGIYERELHSIIDEICDFAPTSIINIGAAEGYYAIGLCQRICGVAVTAFEAEAMARDNLVRNASINGVSAQINVCGLCGLTELKDALGHATRPLIICDVEGQEKVLLDPIATPKLRGADILVETHNFIEPGVTKLLQDRFAPSHAIRLIQQQPRFASEFPWRTLWTAVLPTRYLEIAVSEGRPEIMSWLWMKAANIGAREVSDEPRVSG